jgi:chromosome segregation ATPase
MTRLLSLFGLMRVSEHERNVRALESQLVLRENAFEAIEGERDRLSDKFKKAVTDLEKNDVEIERLTRGWEKCAADLKLVRSQLDDSEAELADMKAHFDQRVSARVEEYQADALLWRNARDKRAGKRGKAS